MKYKPEGASHLYLEEGHSPHPLENFKRSWKRSKAGQRLGSNPRLSRSAVEALTSMMTTRVVMMITLSQSTQLARVLPTTR
jgi:hypothetical protein